MQVVLCFEVLIFFLNFGLLYRIFKGQMFRFSNVLRPLHFMVMERGAICRFKEEHFNDS
jgi:hypothetical protein